MKTVICAYIYIYCIKSQEPVGDNPARQLVCSGLNSEISLIHPFIQSLIDSIFKNQF